MSLSDDEIRGVAANRPARQLSSIGEHEDYQVGDPRIFIDKEIVTTVQTWQARKAGGPNKDDLCRDFSVPSTVDRIARSAKAFLKQNNSSEDAERAHLYWELRFTMVPVESKQRLLDRMADRLKWGSSQTAQKPAPFSWLSEGHFWLTRVNEDRSPRSKAHGRSEQESGPRSQGSSLSSRRSGKSADTPFPPGVPTVRDAKVEVFYDDMFYRERWNREEESIQQIRKDPRDKSKADESVVYWSRYSVQWLVPNKSKGRFGKELEAIHFDRLEAGYKEGSPFKHCGYSEASVAVVWSRE